MKQDRVRFAGYARNRNKTHGPKYGLIDYHEFENPLPLHAVVGPCKKDGCDGDIQMVQAEPHAMFAYCYTCREVYMRVPRDLDGTPSVSQSLIDACWSPSKLNIELKEAYAEVDAINEEYKHHVGRKMYGGVKSLEAAAEHADILERAQAAYTRRLRADIEVARLKGLSAGLGKARFQKLLKDAGKIE